MKLARQFIWGLMPREFCSNLVSLQNVLEASIVIESLNGLIRTSLKSAWKLIRTRFTDRLGCSIIELTFTRNCAGWQWILHSLVKFLNFGLDVPSIRVIQKLGLSH